MNDPPLSPTQHLWQAAGRPESGLMTEACSGACATCGAPLQHGAPAAQITAKSTFSQHADFVQGTHFCPGCAWLYNIGTGKPGNVIALGHGLLFPMLSAESALAADRPTWLQVFTDLALEPAGLPVSGILTTDFKPRLFPRMRLSSSGKLTLYVHATEYDQSGNLCFEPIKAVRVAHVIAQALALGFSKARCHTGLFGDAVRFKRNTTQTMALEHELAKQRSEPHWLPALLASHAPLKGTA